MKNNLEALNFPVERWRPPYSKTLLVKRWSEAESFTIFENLVYMNKKNLMFAQKFVTTPFLVESYFFLYYTSKSLHKILEQLHFW